MSLKKLIFIGLFFLFSFGIAKADITATVQAGDTLSHIALDQTGRANNWPKLTALGPKGQIRDPNLIFPGDIVIIPEELLKTARQTENRTSTIETAQVKNIEAGIAANSEESSLSEELASGQTSEAKESLNKKNKKSPENSVEAVISKTVQHLASADLDPPKLSMLAALLLLIYFFFGSQFQAWATESGARFRLWRIRKKLPKKNKKRANLFRKIKFLFMRISEREKKTIHYLSGVCVKFKQKFEEPYRTERPETRIEFKTKIYPDGLFVIWIRPAPGFRYPDMKLHHDLRKVIEALMKEIDQRIEILDLKQKSAWVKVSADFETENINEEEGYAYEF